jgi:hypothetical protein
MGRPITLLPFGAYHQMILRSPHSAYRVRRITSLNSEIVRRSPDCLSGPKFAPDRNGPSSPPSPPQRSYKCECRYGCDHSSQGVEQTYRDHRYRAFGPTGLKRRVEASTPDPTLREQFSHCEEPYKVISLQPITIFVILERHWKRSSIFLPRQNSRRWEPA